MPYFGQSFPDHPVKCFIPLESCVYHVNTLIRITAVVYIIGKANSDIKE